MKKSLVLTGIALLISAAMVAQEQRRTRTENQPQTQTQTQTETETQTQVQNQTAVQKQEQARVRTQVQDQTTHGQAVSETARNTPSGPGKGEIVSAQARNKGESKQLKNANKAAAKNQSGAVNRNAKGNAMKKAGEVQKGPAAGRK